MKFQGGDLQTCIKDPGQSRGWGKSIRNQFQKTVKGNLGEGERDPGS